MTVMEHLQNLVTLTLLRQSRLWPKWELVRLAFLVINFVSIPLFGIMVNLKNDLTCRSIDVNANPADCASEHVNNLCWNSAAQGFDLAAMILLSASIVIFTCLSWTRRKSVKIAAEVFNSATETLYKAHTESQQTYDEDFIDSILNKNISAPESDVREACINLTMNSPKMDPLARYVKCCTYQSIGIVLYFGIAIPIHLTPTIWPHMFSFDCKLGVDMDNVTQPKSYKCEVTPALYSIRIAAFLVIHYLSFAAQLVTLIYGQIKVRELMKTAKQGQNNATILLLSFLKSARPLEYRIIQRIVDRIYSTDYKKNLQEQFKDALENQDFALIDMWRHMFGQTDTVINVLVADLKSPKNLYTIFFLNDPYRNVFKHTDYSLNSEDAHTFVRKLKNESNWRTLVDFLENSELKQGVCPKLSMVEILDSINFQGKRDAKDCSVLYYAFASDHFKNDEKFVAAKFLIKDIEVEDLKVLTGKTGERVLGLLPFLELKYNEEEVKSIKRELEENRVKWRKRIEKEAKENSSKCFRWKKGKVTNPATTNN